jgi:hypothetical protein
MGSNFGVPPEGDNVRSLVEQRLKQALTEAGAKVTVEWRGEQRHLDVITMPVAVLYFNPDTHRIRPMLSLDPARHKKLEESPWTQESQDYLHHLLRQKPSNPAQVDPDYRALQDELEEFGQKEPGIISREGILVDGNTRRAALLDLGRQEIKVGVLPPDTSRDDINNVELAIQLRRDKRREYSYIARLLTIEEQIFKARRREEDVARDFNIKTTTLKQDLGVWKIIRDAIERSRIPRGAGLREIDFEDHQEKLRELQRDYATVAKTDPEAAEQLKESRLAMVILNFPKTSVRLAEADFHQRYLHDRLTPDLRPAAQTSEAVAIPGLPGVTVPDASVDTKTVRALSDALLKAKAASLAEDKLEAAEVKEANELINSARKAFDTAVKMAGQNAELVKRQIAVPTRLTDAAEHVNQCVKEFAEARQKRALDEDAFDDALTTLRASLIRLAKQASRISDPGEGIAWLLKSTQEG